MRFITTEHEVRQLLHEFQIDYKTEKASWPDDHLDRANILKSPSLRTFLTHVDGLVRKETGQWMTEFQDSLKQIDEAACAKLALMNTGGLNVTVTNGDRIKGGWKLLRDKQVVSTYTGNTAALTGIPATNHLVRIEGQLEGVNKIQERR